MLGLGLGEILLIGIVVLLVIGPDQLPVFMRTAGRYYGQIRRASDELRRAFTVEADRMEAEERYAALQERRKQAEEARKRAQEERASATEGLPEGAGPVAASTAAGPAFPGESAHRSSESTPPADSERNGP
jgi:sec-independent protein translocase protein TatB